MVRYSHRVGEPSSRSRLRMLPLAAGTAFALGSLAGSAFGQGFNWVAPTGNFSDGVNWQGSRAPALSSPATGSRSPRATRPAITATNNIGTPFVANSLAFNVNNAFTLRSFSTSYKFQLAGAAPAINMSGLGTATMVSGGAIQLTSDLNINVAGPGNLILNDVISDDSETGGVQRALTISGDNPVRAWCLVGLGAANSFWGLTLDGGAVTTTEANPTTFGASFSTLTVSPNGGMIAPLGTMSPSLGTLQLNGDLYLVGQASLTLAGGASHSHRRARERHAQRKLGDGRTHDRERLQCIHRSGGHRPVAVAQHGHVPGRYLDTGRGPPADQLPQRVAPRGPVI